MEQTRKIMLCKLSLSTCIAYRRILMKLSRFNVVNKHSNYLLIYNTLTSSVLKLVDPYMSNFISSLELGDGGLMSELEENLSKGKMIVDDDLDELEYISVINNIGRFSNDQYSLTIAPTLKCNFECPYCYEKGIDNPTMSDEVVEKTKILIEELSKVNNALQIAWYGGEPLLAFDIIKDLSQQAINQFEDRYSASIVTNGYLLTEEKVKCFEELRIRFIQITIDGPPDIHNRMRKLPNGKDTFHVILKNITTAFEINPNIQIVIRVNTDKNNIDRTDEILDHLSKYGLSKKVGLYLAPIDNVNNTCNAPDCFACDEFAEEQMKFISRNFKKGYNYLNLPKSNISICGAVSYNSLVVDPSGDLYKCWDNIGNTDYVAGNIFEGIYPNNNYLKWLAYNPLDDQECQCCSYLPICMGGCPHKRIKLDRKTCVPIKFCQEEALELLHNIKKQDAQD